MKKSDPKNQYFDLALKVAAVASLVIALMSCGSGSYTSVASNADTEPGTQPGAPVSTAAAKTAAQLAKFWGRYGAKESFTPMYVEVLT
jgi:hypothetical protein